MTIFVTGVAGFIGYFTARRLLKAGYQVVGCDNLNDYYDVSLKKARLEQLQGLPGFTFYQESVENKAGLNKIFDRHRPARVVHLAAQAGVRYSIENPDVYVQANLVGFVNILEGCRHHQVEHLVYASSSSVYGLNTHYPFSTADNVDHPIALYGATKKSNELMAHAYAHLFRIPATGLRFFTVYGPWGRPDMALFLFTKGILEETPIDVYNNGDMVRDFTYIEDIVDGVTKVLENIPGPDPEWTGDNPNPASSSAPYRIYNIGSNAPVPLMDFIHEIEKNLGKKAVLNKMPIQEGDVYKSHADVKDLAENLGYQPRYNIESGIREFVAWYLDYYGVSLPGKVDA